MWAGSLTTPLPPRLTPRPAEVLGRGSDGSGSSCDLQPGAQQAFPLTALPSRPVSMALLEAARRFSQTASSLGKGTGRGGEAGSVSEGFLS